MCFDYGVKPIKYLDVYPKLPVDAPIGHPHILDLDSLDEELNKVHSLSIADAVVTILFKAMPCPFTTFLDLNKLSVFPLHPSLADRFQPKFLHQKRRAHGNSKMIRTATHSNGN